MFHNTAPTDPASVFWSAPAETRCRDDEGRWVRAVGIATSNDTTRIITQGRADALEYTPDEEIDVCLPPDGRWRVRALAGARCPASSPTAT